MSFGPEAAANSEDEEGMDVEQVLSGEFSDIDDMLRAFENR